MRRMLQRHRQFAIALFTAWVAATCGCHRAAQVGPPPIVSTLTLTAQNATEELPASGVIEAVHKAQVGFMVAGRVQEIAVEDGATVSIGQLLARIDDTDLRNEAAIADARLAETSARNARLTRLHELGSLTATDFEKTNAALQESESAAALAHRRLSYAELRAPFAGRVVRSGIGVGTVVAPGQPVCTVLAPAPVWAILSVPEVDASRIHPAQIATVALAASDGDKVTGTIETILPQADPLTRAFAVKILIANEDGRFRPGNVVAARIQTGIPMAGIVVPPAAVQRFADGAMYVWVLEPSRKVVTRRIVSVGRALGTGVEILSGLNPGDRIVRSGGPGLYDGMEVEVATP